MGQSPDPPDNMIDEGLDFLDMCFKHDPKERATARELLATNFLKIGDDLTSCQIYNVLSIQTLCLLNETDCEIKNTELNNGRL